MGTHFPAAPWATALKVISVSSTVVLLVLGYVAYRAIPVPSGFTHGFGFGVALVFPAILLGAFLFSVAGYDLNAGDLYVRRPLWATRVPLAGLRRAYHEPTACRRSLRVFGNGGLYSFTGLYWNRSLGRFRLFGTDLSRAVVLVLEGRTVVVTPENPEAFVAHLRQLHPDVRQA
jgi:hypothetical protein